MELDGLAIETAQNMSELQSNLHSLSRQRVQLQGEKGYVIKAPVDGRVTALQVESGATVTPATPMMTIVPTKTKLRAEAYAPNRAVGQVQPGQEVRLLYDAFPYQRFGSFKGRVAWVSRTVIDPKDNDAPLHIEEPTYRVSILLDQQSLNSYGTTAPLHPGMTLDARRRGQNRAFRSEPCETPRAGREVAESCRSAVRSGAANELSDAAMGVLELPTHRANVPAEASSALPLLKHRLGRSLSAVYLHGSAVAAGLRTRSDVDLLAVVEEVVPASIRADLSSDLLAVSGHYPFDRLGRRPLEVIIIRRTDLEGLPYPARAEFVYGEWLRTALESGAIPEAEANPEFTLLLAQAREEAVPLIGPDITDLVPVIPSAIIRKAIGDLLPELIRAVEGDERNVLLTLARMWNTATTGQFVSKDSAAEWAAAKLSDRAADILALARDAYLGRAEDELHCRRTEVSQAVDEMRDGIVSALRPFE